MVIAVYNNKGGSGKSTTAVNLGASLAQMGKSVLIVDLDSQCNASKYLSAEEWNESSPDPNIGRSVFDMMFEKADPRSIVRKTSVNGLFCIPSSEKMTNISTRLAQLTISGSESRIVSSFRRSGITQDYDYILIDCPSEVDVITANALNAADYCLATVFADEFSLDGLVRTIRLINEAADNDIGTSIRLLGVLICNYRGNTTAAKKAAADLLDGLPDDTFETKIRQSADVVTSLSKRTPVVSLFPKKNVSLDYQALAYEFIKRIATKGGEQR